MIQMILAKSIGIIAMMISLMSLYSGSISRGGCYVLFSFGNIVLIICEYVQYMSTTILKSSSLQEKYDELVRKYIKLVEENNEYELTIRTLGAVGNGDYIRIIGTLSDIIEDDRYERVRSELPDGATVEEVIINCVKELVTEKSMNK